MIIPPISLDSNRRNAPGWAQGRESTPSREHHLIYASLSLFFVHISSSPTPSISLLRWRPLGLSRPFSAHAEFLFSVVSVIFSPTLSLSPASSRRLLVNSGCVAGEQPCWTRVLHSSSSSFSPQVRHDAHNVRKLSGYILHSLIT